MARLPLILLVCGAFGGSLGWAGSASEAEIRKPKSRLSGVSGHITDIDSGEPLVGARVLIYTSRAMVTETLTDEEGRFDFSVAPGSYYVVTAIDGYSNELYDDIPCPVACAVSRGTRVFLPRDEWVDGLDFDLERQDP